jgi:chaperonin GroEL (HSP60 family)
MVGANPMDLKRGIDQATAAAVEELLAVFHQQSAGTKRRAGEAVHSADRQTDFQHPRVAADSRSRCQGQSTTAHHRRGCRWRGVGHSGLRILARAIEEPLRQIVANAGDDAAVVLNRVRAGASNFGYNAANGEFGDMIELGILDPTKVTRLALQNVASVAGLFLTTEASIVEAPKESRGAAAAPGDYAM